MLKSALCALALLAASPVIAQTPHPAAQIAAAERAFAADGLATGVKAAFLKWSTPDAIMLQSRPVNVHDLFAEQPALKPGESDKLAWWPLWTGIARSGDLGFSTGPIETDGKRDGHYFTVWKKQADGSWRWIYDGGVAASSATEASATAPEAHLPVSTAGSFSPVEAMGDIREIEAAFAAAAARDQKAAHLAVLADDGRLHVAPRPPAKGKAEFAATLDGYPAVLTLGPPLGFEASTAGDLVFDYGKAAWSQGGQARAGHYVHVWQKRPPGPPPGSTGGWKLVFTQIVPVLPPPAAG